MTPSLWASTIVDKKMDHEWVFFSSQLAVVGQRADYTDEEYLGLCKLHAPHAELRIRPSDLQERAGPMNADEIRRLREQEGLSYTAIAKVLGVKRSLVNHWCWRKGYKKGPKT